MAIEYTLEEIPNGLETSAWLITLAQNGNYRAIEIIRQRDTDIEAVIDANLSTLWQRAEPTSADAFRERRAKRRIKKQAASAIDGLQTIIDNQDNLTAAQIRVAIGQLAQNQQRILRVLARLV